MALGFQPVSNLPYRSASSLRLLLSAMSLLWLIASHHHEPGLILGPLAAHDPHMGAHELAGLLHQLSLQIEPDLNFRRIDQFNFYVPHIGQTRPAEFARFN